MTNYNSTIKKQQRRKDKRKKTRKIKKKQLKQYEKCKNNICADTRIIKHSEKIKNTRHNKSKNMYYFLCLESKKLYQLKKNNFNKMKSKIGYLINIEYTYNIYKSKHNLSTMVMFLIKYTEKEIKVDPIWAKDSGITLKTPFAFGYNNSLNLLKAPESKNIRDNNNSINNKRLKRYIKNVEKKLEKEFKTNTNLEAYKDTYENLLNKYYNFCTRSDVDVFKIIRWA